VTLIELMYRRMYLTHYDQRSEQDKMDQRGIDLNNI